MSKLAVGHLFKVKKINLGSNMYEVFERVDFVVGITFENVKNQHLCSVISGRYAGKYALAYGNYESEYHFCEANLDNIIRKNDNFVNFEKIRTLALQNTAKYYMKSENSFTAITDKNTVDTIDKALKIQSEFNEENLDSKSNIATMYNDIKKTIVAQDEQIMQILTALFKNQTVINSDLDADLIAKLKENILICGSTGTGKTEILKRISKLYDIPIVIEDATSLSETGYVGRKITDLLEDLYLSADSDIEKAQKGILVIDEFDKLAEGHTNSGDHVSRIGVQRSLLKLLDGSLFYFDDKKFDTSKLTVVALGAFTDIKQGDDYANLTNDDFIKYGMMRELMGRFSKIIKMNTLTEEDIIKILKESDFSPLNTYKVLFEKLGIEYSYTEDFIKYIAEIAVTKQSGARSLKMVFDEAVGGALFKIFAGGIYKYFFR